LSYWKHSVKEFFICEGQTKFTPTGKRKQALLESNLPGISCSTGMVKEGLGNKPASLSTDHSKRWMPKKTHYKSSESSAVFILLNGSKIGGAYTMTAAERAHLKG